MLKSWLPKAWAAITPDCKSSYDYVGKALANPEQV